MEKRGPSFPCYCHLSCISTCPLLHPPQGQLLLFCLDSGSELGLPSPPLHPHWLSWGLPLHSVFKFSSSREQKRNRGTQKQPRQPAFLGCCSVSASLSPEYWLKIQIPGRRASAARSGCRGPAQKAVWLSHFLRDPIEGSWKNTAVWRGDSSAGPQLWLHVRPPPSALPAPGLTKPCWWSCKSPCCWKPPRAVGARATGLILPRQSGL